MCSSDLAVEVCVEAGGVVVAVHGEVDLESSPLLRTIIRGLLDGGHRTVALDLHDVSFMGAAGLGIIAETAGLLRVADGALTLRSAAPLTLRMLQITGIAQLVQLETARVEVSAVQFASAETGRGVLVGAEPAEIVSDLVRVGSMITATTVVDRALQLVTALAAAAIDGADGVSVSLERHDRISTVAWSNDTVLAMDKHQYQTGEGPCLAAAMTGDWFHIESLAAEDRWPDFVPRAQEEGIASILSSPLTTPARSVGSLNLYSNRESAFGPAQLTLAGLFAEQASALVNTSLTDQEAGARLVQALLDREVIAQAQGVLMGRRRMSAVEAAAELFRTARETELTVSQHAANLIASTEPSTVSDAGSSRE